MWRGMARDARKRHEYFACIRLAMGVIRTALGLARDAGISNSLYGGVGTSRVFGRWRVMPTRRYSGKSAPLVPLCAGLVCDARQQ